MHSGLPPKVFILKTGSPFVQKNYPFNELSASCLNDKIRLEQKYTIPKSITPRIKLLGE